MLIWPKVTDKIPGSLVAIIVTTAIVYFAKLDVNTIGSVYGQLDSSFPKFHVPAISMKLVQQMLSPAFTIAVLAALIPMTTLAAVLLVVAANMADWESFFRL